MAVSKKTGGPDWIIRLRASQCRQSTQKGCQSCIQDSSPAERKRGLGPVDQTLAFDALESGAGQRIRRLRGINFQHVTHVDEQWHFDTHR